MVSDGPIGAIDLRAHPVRVLLRGCVRHCGVCNSGRLFHRWFRMETHCPRCGLRFERIEGHWTGDLGINTIVSFGLLLVVLLVGFLAFWPTPPIKAIIVASVGVAVGMPLAFFPFSKTIWLAFDLITRPLEPGEVRPGYGPQRVAS